MSNLNCKIRASDTSYSGASFTRKQLSKWQPSQLPADVEVLPELATLVARSRDLDRNNGVAAGAFQSLSDNVVGTGLRLSSVPEYRMLGQTSAWAQEWARTTEALWRSFAESTSFDAAGKLNFASMTQLALRSGLQAGEALCLPLWMERKDTPFRTCIQMIDADRLGNPEESTFGVKKNLRGGIEIDDYGKPLAYWIRTIPENLGFGFPMVGLDATRIPAETSWGRKRVIHVYHPNRVDQTRGVPILAPVIEQFRMLDSYQRTELQSSIVNALVAGIIETPMDPAGIMELMGGANADPSKYLESKNQYRVQLEGGSIIPLYPGDKLTPFTPARPPGTFPAFVETVLRQIGNALGMPYELILKDFSKTNYSSARAALLEAWRFFSNRRLWVATYWAQPIYELWLEEAVNAGMVQAPGFYENRRYYSKARWIGPGRGWIDPVKEAQAAILRITNCISTLEMECAEQGLDWQEVIEQRAVEIARFEELGIPLPGNAPAAVEDKPQVEEKVAA